MEKFGNCDSQQKKKSQVLPIAHAAKTIEFASAACVVAQTPVWFAVPLSRVRRQEGNGLTLLEIDLKFAS